MLHPAMSIIDSSRRLQLEVPSLLCILHRGDMLMGETMNRFRILRRVIAKRDTCLKI